ncbi:uncharacterized protein B0P05DRAFT_592638 [Gilbertella persicaria]|uniref:uncharacterized protein n=1 Tax=Gilbertella persicaria TaxID=101096 RepID=UPI002220B4DC|nr:uncharacterized protein B0P05DRAFT_592638 [Gilbertella persicaria]KAI8047430.1 hypothetical protein B0P05DRAFT_592638 [Gilbertella persicaria]
MDVPKSKVLELNRQVTKLINDVFSASPENPHAIPVIPVIGNNDLQPHNYIELNDNVLFFFFFEQLWDHWIPKHQRKDFLKGEYFAADVAPGLRVLSMNTMFFSKKNPLAKACQKQGSSGSTHLEWYQQQLEKSRFEGVKIYVIGHVPPSPRDFFKRCLKDYVGITSIYSDIVFGHFYAYLNMDYFLMYEHI